MLLEWSILFEGEENAAPIDTPPVLIIPALLMGDRKEAVIMEINTNRTIFFQYVLVVLDEIFNSSDIILMFPIVEAMEANARINNAVLGVPGKRKSIIIAF